MLCGYLTGSRYGMNQSKASPRIEYTQVELNVPEFDRLLFVLLIDLGIILHDACLPACLVLLETPSHKPVVLGCFSIMSSAV